MTETGLELRLPATRGYALMASTRPTRRKRRATKAQLDSPKLSARRKAAGAPDVAPDFSLSPTEKPARASSKPLRRRSLKAGVKDSLRAAKEPEPAPKAHEPFRTQET